MKNNILLAMTMLAAERAIAENPGAPHYINLSTVSNAHALGTKASVAGTPATHALMLFQFLRRNTDLRDILLALLMSADKSTVHDAKDGEFESPDNAIRDLLSDLNIRPSES